MAKLDPIELAAEIVKSFVSNNSLRRGDLPDLIQAMHVAVKTLAEGPETAAIVVDPRARAASIRKSVTPDYLICLEDGKHFKSLRRHLAGLGMTPEQYREKWNLPSTYPMVAPNYAAQRSAMAKTIGLGQSRRKTVAALPVEVRSIEVVASNPASGGAVDGVEREASRVAESHGVVAPPRIAETVEEVAPPPTRTVKRKAKAKPESAPAAAPTAATAKRKPGRPRNAKV